MSEPAELVQSVLSRIARFVRGLSTQDLSELAEGTAQLQLVRDHGAANAATDGGAVAGGNAVAGGGTVAGRGTVGGRAAVAGGSAVDGRTGGVGDLPIEVEEVRVALAAMTDRTQAKAYVDGLRLTVAQLRALAKALGLAVASNAPKAQVRDTIVQWTVGRRVDAAVLSRPGASAP